METHGVLGPPRAGAFHLKKVYEVRSLATSTATRRPTAIAWPSSLDRPMREARSFTLSHFKWCVGGGTRQIHKITSEWDSRKGVEDLTPNDLMIKFTERSIEVCKRPLAPIYRASGALRWWQFRVAHDPRAARAHAATAEQGEVLLDHDEAWGSLLADLLRVGEEDAWEAVESAHEGRTGGEQA